MPDTPIGRLFGRVTAEPDADFVAELEARLVAELAAPVDDIFVGTPAEGENVPRVIRHDIPILVVAPAPRLLRRRRTALLAAAVAAVVFVVALVAATGRDHHVITSTPITLESNTSVPSSPTATTASPTTTAAAAVVDAGFEQNMSTDLATADGSSFHFDGTVEFKLAVESNEQSELAVHDVLLLPKVTGTFTNTGSAPATVGAAAVQIFMSGDFPCVKTTDVTCGNSLTVGGSPEAGPVTVQPGANYELEAGSVDSRITVPAADVPYFIDEIANGSKVVGTAVSLADGAGQISATIFDRTGTVMQTCATSAADCMDANRTVLGEDAAPVDTATVSALTFPAGAAPAGTYSPARFVVPYTITTGGPWQMVRDNSDATLLRRHDNIIVSALQVGDGSTLGATTPALALAAICAGDTSQDLVPKSTTMFGQAALEIEGIVTANCAIEHTLKYGDLLRDTFRAVAATVDGHVIYVIGIAPTNDWAVFGPEFEATIASLALR